MAAPRSCRSAGTRTTPTGSADEACETEPMGRLYRLMATAVAVVLLAGVPAAADPPPVDPPPDPEPTSEPTDPPIPATGREVLFNYPVPGTPDLTITDRLVSLIDGTAS